VYNTPAKYLEYNNPKMEEYRRRFKQVMEMESVHCALVLNFDQLWKLRHRGAKTSLWKAFVRVRKAWGSCGLSR
jgi:hypothetical protein